MTAVPRRRMVPAYLATGGRSRPGTEGFERLTVLFADRADRAEPPAELEPEHRRLWELLRPGALTVVEAAAHLRLPVSATVFLAADLVEAGLADRLLLGADTTTRTARELGGPARLLTDLAPRLSRTFGPELPDRLLLANPASAFAVDWRTP